MGVVLALRGTHSICSFGIDSNHCLTWSQDGLGRHDNTPFSSWQSTCAILDRRTTRIYTRVHVQTLGDCRCPQPSSPDHYLPSLALSQPRCISTSAPGLIIPLSVCYPSHHHRVSARLRPSVRLSRADTLCSWSVSTQVGPSITLVAARGNDSDATQCINNHHVDHCFMPSGRAKCYASVRRER